MDFNLANSSDFKLTWTTVSCFISLFALGCSALAYKRSKRVAEKNLNKKFFDEIFPEYIITKIPQKLLKIENERSKLASNCLDLENLIEEILDKIVFYKYFEVDFYVKIRDILVEIDEKLVSIPEGKISNELFKKYNSDLNKLVKKLYKQLKKYYSEI